MEPIVTLYERTPISRDTLPPKLASYYGGGLIVSHVVQEDRPYVIANFVETIDGIVSYNTPGQTGGGVISGNNKQDKMVMGLLRAQADAVIFGSSSLRADANHLRTPAFISPSFASDYEACRKMLGKQVQFPISVIMTASGVVDLNDRTFHTPEVPAIIATTTRGYDYLSQYTLPGRTEVRVIEPADHEASRDTVSPRDVLIMLARDYGVQIALYEGGPTLLASFLADHLVDELFLTIAPQIAGQPQNMHRLPLVKGYAFTPDEALWATLQSVKLAGSHLLLRYSFTPEHG